MMLLASFLSGLMGSLGLGGGGVLLLYLTLVLHTNQLEAQGINLLFFLPVGGLALLLHAKNRLVAWRVALPALLLGVPGVWVGSKLAGLAGALLPKLFGGLLLILGLKEIFARPKGSPRKKIDRQTH